jgi:adenylyltransferase/sulfurtransferase
MQANEVIKLITKTGELLSGKVLLFDAQTLQCRIIKIGAVSKTKIQSLAETSTVPTITAAELKKSIKEYELIDVRSEREHDLFDIGGKNIPADEIEDNIDYFNSDSAKVLYCSTGKRSAEAVKLIKKKYPEAKVFSLEDGLGLWGD